MKAVVKFFKLEQGEGGLSVQLILQYTFLGIAFVFVQTSAFALFVANYGASGLPYTYLATAILGSGLAYGYLRLAERLPLPRTLVFNLAFLALGSVLFWLGLLLNQSGWVIFLLPVWFQATVNLGNLAFWTLAGRVFDIRQSKRLFGLVGAGNWIGTVIAGLAVSGLVNRIGTSSLMLLGGISLLIAILFQVMTLRSQRAKLVTELPTAHRTEQKPALEHQIWRQPYSLLIFGLTTLWWVGFFFVDNIFFNRAAAQFPSADSLANMLGWRVAIEGLLALIFSTFLIGPIIQRFGLRPSLLALPATLTVSLGALALIGSANGPLVMLFLIAAFAKIASIGLGLSLNSTAQRILYQPLPSGERIRVQTLAEGIVPPAAVGLAGAVLLLLTSLLNFGFIQLSLAFVVISVAWFGVVHALLRLYPIMLARNVDRRQLQAVTLNFADGTSIDALRQALHNPSPEAALYAFSQLEQVQPGNIRDELPTLLRHPAVAMRQQALAYLEHTRPDGVLPLIEESLAHETEPEMQQAAIRVLALTGGLSRRVMDALDHPNLQQGALIGLLRSTNTEGRQLAEQRLSALVAATDAADRLTAAEVLGEIGPHSHEDMVGRLLHDPDVVVRRASLSAAAGLPPHQLMACAVPALASHALRAAAIQGLVRGGAAIVPEIEAVFDTQPSDVQRRLVRVCRRVKGEEAIRFLARLIDTSDTDLRTETLTALSALAYHTSDRKRLDQCIRSEAAFAARTLAAERDLGADPRMSVLGAALHAQTLLACDRILTLLAFSQQVAVMRSVREALVASGGVKRAYALELLESFLSNELKPAVLPLFDLTAAALHRLFTVFPQKVLTPTARVQDILASPGTPFWVRVCAINMNDDGRNDGMLSLVERVLILKSVSIFASTPDQVLAEIAPLLHEEHLVLGQSLFNKGDAGDSLFIIVSGRVRVHDGDHTLNELGDRAVVGEMALLDPEPRVASVTALEDTDLLRLEQEPFFELMADRIEVVRGVMHVITTTLRDRLRDIASLREQLQATSKTNV